MNELNVEEEMDYNTRLLKSDLDRFMEELIERGTYVVDVYDLCVNCGHDLTWDHQYTIREKDLNWLKTEGYHYFFNKMNTYLPINTTVVYSQALDIYTKLFDLFSVVVEEY